MMVLTKALYPSELLHTSVSQFIFSDSRNMVLLVKMGKVMSQFRIVVNFKVLQNTLKL